MELAVSQSVIEQFENSAKAAVATIEVIERAPRALCDAILGTAGNVSRILFAPPQDLPADLFAEFVRDLRVVADPSVEEWVSTAVGVTEAFAGVARTGSVCVDVGYQCTGLASLIAPLHIAVLAAETIVPKPGDLFREDVLGGKGLSRSFVFITGPSATADMGPLVRGVHGPHRLHIIVLR